MEGLALTGAWTDAEKGLVGLIVLEMGGSSELCAHAASRRAGDPDGPDRHAHGNAGGRNRAAGGRWPGQRGAVLDRPGAARGGVEGALFRRLQETAATATRSPRSKRRPTSWSGRATRRQAFSPRARRTRPMPAASSRASCIMPRGSWGRATIRLQDVDRIIAIGSDGMMAAVQRARHQVLKAYLKPSHCAVGSINSPMQCMMKEICAQCLQPHRDPVTGKEIGRLLLLQPGPGTRPRRLRAAASALGPELSSGKTDARLDQSQLWPHSTAPRPRNRRNNQKLSVSRIWRGKFSRDPVAALPLGPSVSTSVI